MLFFFFFFQVRGAAVMLLGNVHCPKKKNVEELFNIFWDPISVIQKLLCKSDVRARRFLFIMFYVFFLFVSLGIMMVSGFQGLEISTCSDILMFLGIHLMDCPPYVSLELSMRLLALWCSKSRRNHELESK